MFKKVLFSIAALLTVAAYFHPTDEWKEGLLWVASCPALLGLGVWADEGRALMNQGLSETPHMLIEDWEDNLSVRQVATFWDKETFARRQSYFSEEVSFAQYQAFLAFGDVFGFMPLDGMSKRDRYMVLRHTLGTQYPERSDQELEVVLDAHLNAAQRFEEDEARAPVAGVIA